MKQDELLEILRNGESSAVEFKTEDVHANTLAEEIAAFANFEGGTVLQFDETPVLKAAVQSIDPAKVNAYLAHLQQSPLDMETEELLIRELLHLSVLTALDGGPCPTLAGLLMFGKHPQRYFPAYSVRCGAYHSMIQFLFVYF